MQSNYYFIIMKRTLIIFYIIFTFLQSVNCQSTLIVKKNEIVQVLDKFLAMSLLPGNDHGGGYVVKLIKERSKNTYSISITSPTYLDDLPQKPLYCLKFKEKYFFITHDNETSINTLEFDSSIFFQDILNIRKFAFKVVFEGGVLSFPSIIVFYLNKENHLCHFRKVQFETFHPIVNLPKKYWPIEQPVNSITNRAIDNYFDVTGKLNESYKTYLENGKGNFKIKTR